MRKTTERKNLFVSAYSLVKRSGFLQTSVGSRIFRSAYFLYKRYVEDDLDDLVHAYPSLVKGGDILDIGANLGYTAAVLARVIEPGHRVYAFEPESYNFGILEKTALHAEFKGKIIAMPYAVGAEAGTIDLWINDHHHADHRVITEQFSSLHPGERSVSTTLVSVDSFLKINPAPIAFVKIDVQGYELAVCQGMQETLRRNPDIAIVLEFMPTAMRELGFEPSHLIDFLVARDFKIYRIHPRGKLSMGVPDIMDDSTYFDLLFSRHSIAFDQKL